ncbi:pyridine nucleotide-disulfide oxidoreductase domain-containing protein 1 isoform X1 [Nasonia vitripennis]|uniref:Pyridine nucleotide-disulfide oxidoreductase domain-containing protein 1 n=1 Tax=Nasonia vitripennis TaxID=7425 RepID=A0A7M7QRW5_NASVI|nr:pyridine nucleotide-disulfide oxidoreductase domain-containing protein 1 isoform X1 [Nasonia vitripennis]
MEATFVIIGGGISGVSCAESIAFLAPNESIILITASPLIKAVTNVVTLGKTLTQFDVEERSTNSLTELYPSINVINDVVAEVDKNKKTIKTESGNIISYKKLCICTGARPKLICENNIRVIGIRDTESVEKFMEKLKEAKRIVVVGNGGIATELVHEISGVDVVWVIKDKHISATFVDPGAAEFFQEKLLKKDSDTESKPVKRMKYTITSGKSEKGGPALGPDWHNNFKLKDSRALPTSIQVEYECEVHKIINQSEISHNETEKWPIYVELTNGKIIGCDIVVSATGVIPNSNMVGLESLKKATDGGYIVDWKLETSEKDIFAAGDVCTAGWDIAWHWIQMRLWTQAHQMGRYAAKSMFSTLIDEEFLQDFCFELFTHVTKFFGYKVILLGLYNGQKLDKDYEILLRVTKGHEYVKLILSDGKLQGAVLIGETDLEEMCENLILDQLDLSIYGEDLLNPDIDIEDYFD